MRKNLLFTLIVSATLVLILLVIGVYLLVNSTSASSEMSSMMGVSTTNYQTLSLVLILSAIIGAMVILGFFLFYSNKEKSERKRIETLRNIDSVQINESVLNEYDKMGARSADTRSFAVFLCYKKSSGKDYADHLKTGLEELGLHTFEDCKDIPRTIDTQEGWAMVRDKALQESKYFVLIMTPGFWLSSEVIKEIGMARKQNDKAFVLFRHRSMERNILIDLGYELFDIGKLEQVSFETKEELLRLASNILLKPKTT